MADLPTVARLDWHTILKADAETPAATIAALDAYFEPFAQPEFDDKRGGEEKPMLCLKCREPLTGFFASMFGRGGFEWGIAHGEGRCRCCGWPARAMHYIKDADGQEVANIRNLVLQYHPDEVTERAPAKAETAHA